MHFSMLIRALKREQLMGQRNQGIFSIEKKLRAIAINRNLFHELTMTLMRLKYFNRLTALIYIYK